MEIVEEWVTPDELVAEMKLKNKKWLYNQWTEGKGPERFKVGREVRMTRRAIRAWQATLKVAG